MPRSAENTCLWRRWSAVRSVFCFLVHRSNITNFHVTLPSDSLKVTYSDNTISCYTTQLTERVEFDGEYEVGLAEFIFPHTWFNFKNDDEKRWIVAKGKMKVKVNWFNLRVGTLVCYDGAAFAGDLNRQTAKATIDIAHINAYIRFTFNPATLRNDDWYKK